MKEYKQQTRQLHAWVSWNQKQYIKCFDDGKLQTGSSTSVSNKAKRVQLLKSIGLDEEMHESAWNKMRSLESYVLQTESNLDVRT